MAGDLLPPEHLLAEQFQVNRHTLRRAVEELIDVGFVNRIHGKGTIILQTPINYAINGATRFTETLESQGRRTVSCILDRKEIQAKDGVARRLRVAEGSPVIQIKTMRHVDGIAFCTSSHFFRHPEYSAVLVEYNGGSLHDFVHRCYGIGLRRILSLISAVLPTKEDARRLNLRPNDPILRTKSLNVNTADGWPVEYVVTRFRGDGVQLSVEP